MLSASVRSAVAEKDITFVCADKRLTTLVKIIGFPIFELWIPLPDFRN